MLNIGKEGKNGFSCDFSSYRMASFYIYDCSSQHKPACGPSVAPNVFYPTCVGEVTDNS